MVVLQAFGGSVKWDQLPVYVLAELLAGVAAGAAYTIVSRTRADSAAEVPAVSAADNAVLEAVS
jgi:glycerol uptake facilitator protein